MERLSCASALEPCAPSTSGRCPPLRLAAPLALHRSLPPSRRRLPPCRSTVQEDTPSATPSTPPAPQDLPETSPVSPSRPPPLDPYRAAGQRLERLLAGVGDGEEELLSQMLMEEPVENKVGIALSAGLAISAATATVCWLVGLDPAGGASLSVNTLRAAAIGAAAAVPLVGLKAALWSDRARAVLPFLDEVQQRQIDEFQPILYNLNPAQTAVILGSEVVPGLIILLPAVVGGISKTLGMYFSLSGVEPPQSLPESTALAIAALIVGAAKLVELTPTTEEYDTVKDALDNADRFYAIVGQGRDSSAADKSAAAAAFRAVALTWLARRQVAARFAGALTAAEVLFLGVLWHWTGDFAAPLVAGVASAAVDFDAVRRTLPPAPPPHKEDLVQ